MKLNVKPTQDIIYLEINLTEEELDNIKKGQFPSGPVDLPYVQQGVLISVGLDLTSP